jgi:phospholipid/cholesterol/gamma-HCH transport system substrate-binding protein
MSASRDIKVGAFVLAGLLVTAAVIFMIGDQRQMFQSKVEFHVKFTDVDGLTRGSPVRMGGVDIGSVSNVGYPNNPKDSHLYVDISVVQEAAPRIRTDSVATIGNKGLLGDKMIVISPGSSREPVIPPGGFIPSKELPGLSDIISKVSGKADDVLSNLDRTTHTLADDQFNEHVKQSAQSLSDILASLDHGPGYASRLLHDRTEADHLSQTVANLQKTTAELNRTIANVNNIVGRVEQGPGFAHEVIYGKGGAKTLEQFGNAAGELALTLRGIRQGNGVAKSLIYGDDHSQQIMGNLTAMTSDLRHIVADARAGKGTVGALLVDPSVYEDIKMLLGNVQRNQVLRALVRYSIKRDESESPRVEVRDTAPSATSAGSGDRPATASGGQ